MASVISATTLDVAADRAWALLRDVGAAVDAFPGMLVASRLNGTVRTVTFANGAVVREQIIAIDDVAMRISYAVLGGRFIHHNASMQLIAQGSSRSRFMWISDFLPNAAEPLVRSLVEQGALAFKRAVEGAP